MNSWPDTYSLAHHNYSPKYTHAHTHVQAHLSSAMECSCSPPSSNGTLSPPNTLSPKHQTAHPHFSSLSPSPQQHQHPPTTGNFCHQSPPIVHVATQGETDDSAVLLPRPINPAVIPSMPYASPNFKQFSSAPSFIYPGAGPLMNQHVLQPMWHWILYLLHLHTQDANTFLLFSVLSLPCATNSEPDSDILLVNLVRV